MKSIQTHKLNTPWQINLLFGTIYQNVTPVWPEMWFICKCCRIVFGQTPSETVQKKKCYKASNLPNSGRRTKNCSLISLLISNKRIIFWNLCWILLLWNLGRVCAPTVKIRVANFGFYGICLTRWQKFLLFYSCGVSLLFILLRFLEFV